MSDHGVPRAGEPGGARRPAGPARDRRSPLLVAVGGPTGAGKSTLVNSLVRAPVSQAGILRPTTRRPVLAVHPHSWATVHRHRLTPIAAPALPAYTSIVDAPDFTAVTEHDQQSVEIFSDADMWIFTTTAARYADAEHWQHLRAAQQHRVELAVVLNRVAPGAAEKIVPHLTQLLGEPVPLFVVPEVPLDGTGLLPTRYVAPIWQYLQRMAMARMVEYDARDTGQEDSSTTGRAPEAVRPAQATRPVEATPPAEVTPATPAADTGEERGRPAGPEATDPGPEQASDDPTTPAATPAATESGAPAPGTSQAGGPGQGRQTPPDAPQPGSAAPDPPQPATRPPGAPGPVTEPGPQAHQRDGRLLGLAEPAADAQPAALPRRTRSAGLLGLNDDPPQEPRDSAGRLRGRPHRGGPPDGAPPAVPPAPPRLVDPSTISGPSGSGAPAGHPLAGDSHTSHDMSPPAARDDITRRDQ